MNSRGQVYPLFGIMLIVLIGISALSVDVGYYRYQQRQQQAAADSAAIAGAQATFYDSTNSANSTNAAKADAGKNGFTDGSGQVTVLVNSTFTDAGNCSSGCVQVTINKTYPAFFGSIFANFGHTRKIQTKSAAKLQAVAGSCWTSLGPTSVTTIANGVKIVGPNCGISDADSTTINGGSQDVASWSLNASGTNSTCDVCVLGIPPDDPCSVTPQCGTLASATAADLGISSTTATNPTCNTPLTVGASSTLTPGCYNCVAKTCKFSNVTLQSGLYVITGTVEFDHTVTGSNVTLYFTPGATYTDQTNADVTLSAPPIGNGAFSAYGSGEEGVLMYQTKKPTATWNSSLQATVNWTGLTYMPNWNVTINGHNDTTITGNFAANKFTVNGAGATFTLNPGDGTTSAGPKIAALVE